MNLSRRGLLSSAYVLIAFPAIGRAESLMRAKAQVAKPISPPLAQQRPIVFDTHGDLLFGLKRGVEYYPLI